MARKKNSRPTWFKMFLHQKAIIESVTDETAGKALKAAFTYFDTGECGELDPLAFAVFSAIKPYIDESFQEFQRSVDMGKEGAKKRWANDDSPPIPSPYHPIGVSREEEAEAEEEVEVEEEVEGEKRGVGREEPKRKNRADKPPTCTRFSPPSVEQVREYCRERQLQGVDPERFVDYYQSNGWKIGKNPMKDWKAAARNWSRKEQDRTEVKHEALGIRPGSIGEVLS